MLEAFSLSPEAFTSSVAERERLPIGWWEARMSDRPDPPERVVGAFNHGDLLGAAGLSLEQRERTRHKATLFGMYVRGAARGRGIGRLLVEEVLRQARAADLEVVQRTVSEPNRHALDLYAR